MTFILHRNLDIAVILLVYAGVLMFVCSLCRAAHLGDIPPDPPSHCVKRPLAYDWSTEPEDVA